jgi:hypothetical protein
MPDDLLVTTVHRRDCAFGSGFYRVTFTSGQVRYCQTPEDVAMVASIVGNKYIRVVEADQYCLQGDRQGDANTPDVVDAEHWLGLPRQEAMESVGLTNERDYARVYKQVEAAVGRRNDRESQTGVHASIVLKKRGRPIADADAMGHDA